MYLNEGVVQKQWLAHVDRKLSSTMRHSASTDFMIPLRMAIKKKRLSSEITRFRVENSNI